MHAEISDAAPLRDHRLDPTFITYKTQPNTRGSFCYRLTARQQPKKSRMCGVGERFDRRPVDPPPVIQLEIIGTAGSKYNESLLYESPWFFMCATLLPYDVSDNAPFQLETTMRSATGCMVSSLNHLKDMQDQNGAFFVFPDISIRVDGQYRFRMTLFEIAGDGVHCRDSINTEPFIVYPAKKFPGMDESTSLSRLFAEQGLKIRIRKEVRAKRRNSKRRQLVEQAVARLEAESTANNLNQMPSSEGSVGSLSMSSPIAYRSQLQVNDIPSTSIVLPRNILDTHGRSVVPIQNPNIKLLPPFLTTIPDMPGSNVLSESAEASRRPMSSEQSGFGNTNKANNHDRHQLHIYDPFNDSSSQHWSRHSTDQQYNDISEQSRHTVGGSTNAQSEVFNKQRQHETRKYY